MMRPVRAGLAALAMLVPVAPHPASASPPETASIERALTRGFAAFSSRFVGADGRVHDDHHGFSHSEGQGYAMLLAALVGDEPAFARVWGWTRRELFVRGDGLAAWRWEPGATPHVTDANNATDGDILIAWALLEAAARFDDPALARDANDLVAAIARGALVDSDAGPMILPGVEGFAGAGRTETVVNPSYWVFPALERFSEIDAGGGWDEVTRAGIDLLAQARFGPLRLHADWVSLEDARPPAPADGFPARFSYNAVRIPLYLAWSRDPPQALLSPYARMWDARADIGPFEVDLATGAATQTMGGEGYRAIGALAACVVHGDRFPDRLRSVPTETYYSTILHLMSLHVLQEMYPRCL